MQIQQIIIFRGTTYDAGTSTNIVEQVLPLAEISSTSLNGGGNDIVFERLTGETDNYGTVFISIPGTTVSSTITIYETGLVEKN